MVEQEFLELVQYEDYWGPLTRFTPPADYGSGKIAIPGCHELCCRRPEQPRLKAWVPAPEMQQA